ncbi:unnamed protein product [Prorocentrum cordatum]|uniref:Uncharacterized protein n=1 Tax=Prorocentrum cordatum TaxID=2364126 RepID=A0ABN9PEE1_9DINO|nr:unnamed protein product [Polarella glacialis]
MHSVRDGVIFCASVFCLLVHVALLVSSGTLSRFAGGLYALLRRLRCAVRPRDSTKQTQTREDLIALKVADLVMSRRADYARVFIHPFSLICVIHFVFMAMNFVSDRERKQYIPADAVFVALYLTMLFLLRKPCSITPSTVQLWGSWGMLLVSVGASPWGTPSDRLYFLSTTAGVVRLGIGLCMLNLPALLFWNAVYPHPGRPLDEPVQ